MSKVSPYDDLEAQQQEKKRLRTKTACDYCRKRKAKCNGEIPCGTCMTHNRECIYTVVPKVRKKRVSKNQGSKEKKHNLNSIQGLSSRLSTLENLLSKLVSRLDSNNLLDGAPSNKESKDGELSDTVSLASHSSTENSEDEEDGSEDIIAPILNEKSTITDEKKLREMLKPSESKSCQIVNSTRDRILQYFGSHSMFAIFSAKSIKWMKTRIDEKGNDELLLPIKNLPLALNNAVHSSMKIWTESSANTNKNTKLFFTNEDKNIIFEILEFYYENINIAPFLCSLSTIRELFQIYYYAISSNDFEVINSISQSEMLLMNISLALCLINNSEKETFDKENFPNLASKSISELTEFRQRLFLNSVACYEKISIVCEGLRSVQGIALLTLYIEASYITDFQINYMLASVMIRYASDLGLNTVECIREEDTEEMGDLKRRLWWFCEYIDIETCYRTGKSSLINYSNVSILTEEDDYFISVPLDPFKNDAYKKNASELIKNCQKKGYRYYYVYFSLMLSRIKVKSYNKLYNHNASKLSQDELMDILQEINDDMSKMAKLMEPELRPTLYYIKRPVNSDFVKRSCYGDLFESDKTFFHYSTLLLQLSFFAHLISINRVPFMNNLYESNERTIKYGNLSLESARTILHLVVDLDKKGVPASIINWIKFYPFMAYCSLLGHSLAFPKEISTHSDCVLLIRVSMNFFAFRRADGSSFRSWEETRVYDNKNTMFDLITRLLLRVLINLMDKESSHHYADEIKGLKDHIDGCASIYPDLFKNSDSIRPLNLIFNNYDRDEESNTTGSSKKSPVSFQSVDTPASSSNSAQSKPSFTTLINPSDGDINFDQLSEESFSSLISSQLNYLPNFFFDGNYDFGGLDNNQQQNDLDYFMD
ncbi:uncharacterized protein RJT20DRAFT_9085 [Scheffersomyces xylosifermentans]|uniref:uncharacterized protein n=1 Tax=Scheffersomyces xylosifermentans TaxID=1304137 RepID=UPI00315D4838